MSWTLANKARNIFLIFLATNLAYQIKLGFTPKVI